MNRAHELTPRVSALHLLAYTAMMYADDCQNHSNKKVAEIGAYTRKALKRYLDGLDSSLDRELIDRYQLDIDDQLKNQIPDIHGDKLENKHRARMEVYCVAVELAAREVLKYRQFMRSWFVDETMNASKAVRWCFNSAGIEASEEGRKVFEAVLKYNLDEYAASGQSER